MEDWQWAERLRLLEIKVTGKLSGLGARISIAAARRRGSEGARESATVAGLVAFLLHLRHAARLAEGRRLSPSLRFD